MLVVIPTNSGLRVLLAALVFRLLHRHLLNRLCAEIKEIVQQ